jgi:hypothetical protein
VLTRDLFLRVNDEKSLKKQGRLDQLHLLAAILAQWWRLVASNKALDLFYWAMWGVLHRRTAEAIKMAISLVYLLVVVCLPVALAAAGAIRSE